MMAHHYDDDKDYDFFQGGYDSLFKWKKADEDMFNELFEIVAGSSRGEGIGECIHRKPIAEKIPFVLTEEEQKHIRNKIFGRKRLKVYKTLRTIEFSVLFKSSNPLRLIEKIQQELTSCARKINVDENLIKIENNSHSISFYYDSYETDEMFNESCERAFKEQLEKENAKRYKILERERIKKEKNKAALIKLVNEIGPDVYDVFKEITDEKNTKNLGSNQP